MSRLKVGPAPDGRGGQGSRVWYFSTHASGQAPYSRGGAGRRPDRSAARGVTGASWSPRADYRIRENEKNTGPRGDYLHRTDAHVHKCCAAVLPLPPPQCTLCTPIWRETAESVRVNKLASAGGIIKQERPPLVLVREGAATLGLARGPRICTEVRLSRKRESALAAGNGVGR